MRICLVCDGYPPALKVGGIERFTQILARGLVSRGNHVSVVGYSKGVERVTIDDDQGVRVVRIPQLKRCIFPRAITERILLEKFIRREVHEFSIQLVETHDVRGPLLTGRFSVPLIVRMHGALFVHAKTKGQKAQLLTPFFEKRNLRIATYLIAVSRYIRNATLSDASLENRPCKVIYNGIDTDVFRPVSFSQREMGRILFVGRLSETKGAPNLFKALPSIFENIPTAKLKFIGKDPTEANGHKASINLMARLPYKYHKRVEIVGEISNDRLPFEYQSAAVAVFPSLAEAHPISVLEAMACGTPTVFMQTGPGKEMIDDGIDGVLCDTRSPDAIAEAVISVLANPDFASSLGEQAALRVLREHGIEKFMANNLAFFSECVEQSQ